MIQSEGNRDKSAPGQRWSLIQYQALQLREKSGIVFVFSATTNTNSASLYAKFPL